MAYTLTDFSCMACRHVFLNVAWWYHLGTRYSFVAVVNMKLGGYTLMIGCFFQCARQAASTSCRCYTAINACCVCAGAMLQDHQEGLRGGPRASTQAPTFC